MYYLDGCDGWLCVVQVTVSMNEPIKEFTYWPVTKCSPSDLASLKGTKCLQIHPHVYRAKVDGTNANVPDYDWTICLADGEACKPIKFETEVIPCPKTRKGTKTRWYNGRWQKWTESKGWSAL